MSTTNINIRTQSALKGKAQEILSDLGLDMTTAINLYLQQIVYKEAIPFAIDRGKQTCSKKARSELRGYLKNRVWMAEDFDAPLEEMRDYMR